MSIVSLPRRQPVPGRRGFLKILSAVFVGCASLALAGCGPTGGGMNFGSNDSPLAAPTTPVQSQALNSPNGAPVGETIGSGPVRIGVVLPLTQGGSPSAIGGSLRNAAALAIQESGGSDVTLMVLDDHSTPEGAAQAELDMSGTSQTLPAQDSGIDDYDGRLAVERFLDLLTPRD